MILHHRIVSAALLATLLAVPGRTAEPTPLPLEQFDQLHKQIKPQAGEIKFWAIPWLLSLAEARQLAAAEGKPILVWSGAGGAPIGLC